ncbi:hypothetical protein SRHO_G00253940 [Serrasalmus rhombeus]
MYGLETVALSKRQEAELERADSKSRLVRERPTTSWISGGAGVSGAKIHCSDKSLKRNEKRTRGARSARTKEQQQEKRVEDVGEQLNTKAAGRGQELTIQAAAECPVGSVL